MEQLSDKRKPVGRSAAGAERTDTGKRNRRKGSNVSLSRRVARYLVSILFKAVWAVTWRFSLVCLIILVVSVAYFHLVLPDADELLDVRTRGSAVILDRDGRAFAWRGDQFGGAITVDNVSPHLKNAVIAAEDKRFYQHFGISPRGILGAIVINLREGRGPFVGHGGSTITQQVAKLLCLGKPYDPGTGQSERSYERDCRQATMWRKIKEIPFAIAMEVKFTKNEILMVYLNRSYLGAGATGFQAASQRYFGKPASEVTPAEAAMLAGLLAAPSRYAPTRNIERSRKRAGLVVAAMRKEGYLSAAEATEALSRPAELSVEAANRAGGHFADWVMDAGPEFLTSKTTEDVNIATTFDVEVQKAADEALAHVFETKVRPGSRAQAAIVVMSPNGAVRAIVGGRKTETAGQFNRATQALRQTGSVFKPFVYLAALESGYRYDDLVVDEPVTIHVPGSGNWRPRNYKDEYSGEITLTEALGLSANSVAAKVSGAIGRPRIADIARKLGIKSTLVDGPAFALGASEATLLEMTSAYAGILKGGRTVNPYGLMNISRRTDGTLIMERSELPVHHAISRDSARQLTYMLYQAVEEGTGKRAKLVGWQVAGKTGTTQAARDAWFIGFSTDYVAGVWMGYDDNTPLTGVTGGGLPAEIWRETMTRIHSGREPGSLPMLNPEDRTERVADTTRVQPKEREERKGIVGLIERLLGAERPTAATR